MDPDNRCTQFEDAIKEAAGQYIPMKKTKYKNNN